MHSTYDLEDEYMGSGTILKRSLEKYGRHNHTKEILEFCESRDLLILREWEIITDDLVSDPYSMNLRRGGEGGFTSEQQKENNRRSQQAQQILRTTNKEWTAQKARKISESNLVGYANGTRQVMCQPHIPGEYQHTEEIRQKISKAKKGKCVRGNNPKARKVMDDIGNIFECIKDYAEQKGVHPDTVSLWIKQGKIIRIE